MPTKLDLNLITNIIAFVGVLVQVYAQVKTGGDIGSALNTVLAAVALYFTGKSDK